MKSYIETLQEKAEADRRRQEANHAKSARSDSRVLCDKPLTQQIEELMLSLPPVERQRRWSMAEFVLRLSGRYRENPHPMAVGTALRSLGWTQARDWSANGGGTRYWRFSTPSK